MFLGEENEKRKDKLVKASINEMMEDEDGEIQSMDAASIDLSFAKGGVLPAAHIGKLNELEEDARYNTSLQTGYRINY